jgi:hypothetical protein
MITRYMGFSAAANFVGSRVLGTLGVVTLTKVKHQRELMAKQHRIHQSGDQEYGRGGQCDYSCLLLKEQVTQAIQLRRIHVSEFFPWGNRSLRKEIPRKAIR